MTQYESLALLAERDDLSVFGSHAFPLLALESRFGLSDIVGLAPSVLTDGDHDKKCDLLYVGRESRTAVICQSYRSEAVKDNPPLNKASDLHTAVSWVLAPSSPESIGPELAAAREELMDALTNGDIDDLEVWYCHNLAPSMAVERELDQVAMAAKSILANQLSLSEVNARGVEVTPSRVDEWLRRNDGRVVIHDTIIVPAENWLAEEGEGWKGVYTSVSAAWLHELYLKYQSERLFAGNIRGDMKPRRSAGDINNGIQTTVRERGRQLWAYNNGITALVGKISVQDGKLQVRGISIVNGAQTTGSIGRLDASKTDLSRPRVLIRFVESADPDVVRDISTYNNTQNEILPSDFRSSDPVQARLVAEFAASRSVEYWGPRRGGSGKGARRPPGLLDADLVAQALAAFHGAPDTAYHAKNQIWKDNVIYSRFFSERTTAEHVVLAVGLVKAIRRHKLELRSLPARTMMQEKTFDFFSHRGSDFLFAAAIARCIEEILARPVVDRWNLSFGSTVSLQTAEEYWLPVVKSLANYVDQLLPAARSGDLRDANKVEAACANFQSRVATGRDGVVSLDQFSPLVVS